MSHQLRGDKMVTLLYTLRQIPEALLPVGVGRQDTEIR